MPDNDALRPIDTRNRVRPASGGAQNTLKRRENPEQGSKEKHPSKDEKRDDNDKHEGGNDGHIDEYV